MSLGPSNFDEEHFIKEAKNYCKTEPESLQLALKFAVEQLTRTDARVIELMKEKDERDKRLDELKKEKDERLEELRKEKDERDKRLDELKKERDERLEELRKEKDERLDEKDERLGELRKEKDERLDELKKEKDERLKDKDDLVNQLRDEVTVMKKRELEYQASFKAVLANRAVYEAALRDWEAKDPSLSIRGAKKRHNAFVCSHILDKNKLRERHIELMEDMNKYMPVDSRISIGNVIAELYSRLSEDLHFLDFDDDAPSGVYIGRAEPAAQALGIVMAEMQRQGIFTEEVTLVNQFGKAVCKLSEGQVCCSDMDESARGKEE